jgi:hypothetical protein
MSNRALSCRHVDYLHLPLNGLTTVAHALIRAKPRLSCHASTPQRLWLNRLLRDRVLKLALLSCLHASSGYG